MRRTERERGSSRDFVLGTVHRNATALLGLARRHSLCADDAHDAYQRGVEIFLRRADTVEPETALAWLRTVIKHEALAVRRSRLQLVGGEEIDLDQHEASTVPSPDEQVASFERLTASAEALQRLKPQEVRALWLKAQGLTYEEIGEVTGWSYTKVNRCITEGRRAFLERYRQIESGEECERWTNVLSAIADGEATPDQLVEVRPHLRNCPACRATIRAFHSTTDDLGAILPIPALVAAGGGAAAADAISTFHDRVGQAAAAARAALATARDALAGLASRAPGGGEAAGAALAGGGGTLAAGGAKLAALCASVTVAAGGTYCLTTAVGEKPDRKGRADVANARRVVASDRLRAKDRFTERGQKQANAVEIVNQRIAAAERRRSEARERERLRERRTQSTAAQPQAPQQTTTPPAAQTEGTFPTFETDDSQPQTQPANPPPPAPSTSGAEFGGGGFEK